MLNLTLPTLNNLILKLNGVISGVIDGRLSVDSSNYLRLFSKFFISTMCHCVQIKNNTIIKIFEYVNYYLYFVADFSNIVSVKHRKSNE